MHAGMISVQHGRSIVQQGITKNTQVCMSIKVISSISLTNYPSIISYLFARPDRVHA